MTAIEPDSIRVSQSTGPADIVVVGGGGHVGLPLSLKLCEVGFRVAIYDTAQATVARILGGAMPFMEPGTDALLVNTLPTGRLTAGMCDVSKRAADLIAQACAVSYGLPIAIARCGNIWMPPRRQRGSRGGPNMHYARD